MIRTYPSDHFFTLKSFMAHIVLKFSFVCLRRALPCQVWRLENNFAPHAFGAHGGLKRASNTLELELQVVRCHVGVRNHTWVLCMCSCLISHLSGLFVCFKYHSISVLSLCLIVEMCSENKKNTESDRVCYSRYRDLMLTLLSRTWLVSKVAVPRSPVPQLPSNGVLQKFKVNPHFLST